MSTRKAKKPLNQQANQAANQAVAKKYCPQPLPGDPNYGAFRQDWMNAYAAAGGETEVMTPKQTQQQVAQDRAAAKKNQGQRGAIGRCPDKGGNSPPPPPPPAKTDPECPCKLQSLDVKCQHGRSARNELLMVVADEGGGDTISVTPKASGDCSSKLEVRVDGAKGFPKKGSSASSFNFSGTTMASGNVLKLWQAKPVTTFVSAGACAGALNPIKIMAYPSSKAAIKINIKELREKYLGILAYLPINVGGGRAPVRPISTPKPKGWEAKKYEQALAAEAQWKEDKNSNNAYCDLALNGGFDPLIGTCLSYPIYGVPVSPTMAKYIKCGLYLNVGLGVSFGANCTWSYWPHEDQFHWSVFKLELAGKVTVELAAELLVASPDVIQIKAGGKTEGTIKGWGEKESNKYPAIKGKGEFNPLTAGFTFTLAWGLVEYERAWPLFSTKETDEYTHVFD